MKILVIFSLIVLAYSAQLGTNRSPSLADDFQDIAALIPKRELTALISRYLTNDPEFLQIILYFGSPEAYKAGVLIGSQPEVRELYLWLKEQYLAGSSKNLSDDDSSEKLENPQYSKNKSLRGWKGFMEELLAIYPRKEIRSLIRQKVAANGVFAEFWRKMMALKPVYERILKSEEVIKVVSKLRELGVDTKQLDEMIREDFDWGSSEGLKLA